MKIKRWFPFLVLFVLSLIVSIAMPMANFFSLRSQGSILKTLDPSLQNRLLYGSLISGLEMAALVLACVWAGAGINSLLIRIKDASKRRLVTAGVVFGSFFLCVVLPILSLIFTYTVFAPRESWEPFPALPETPKAIAGGVYNKVVIETENGNYFSCSPQQVETCWQADDRPDPTLLHPLEGSDIPNVLPPGRILYMIGVPSYPGSISKIYYAILEDHTVWYLASQTGSTFFTTALLATVLTPVLLGSLLMLLGMGLTSLLRWLAGSIWQQDAVE